jgi:2,5-diamino-6-(ribosylamino)-4(3H)-pyrimidinone 5'-phosphate reductase
LRGVRVTVGGFMSIDGKIAPANRVGREFTKFMTPRHHRLLHGIRSSVDAVIVGVDTVIADDPSLTVRMVKGKNPARVVLDSEARTPLTSKILNVEEAPTIIAVSQKASDKSIRSLKSKNIHVVGTNSQERVDLRELMGKLTDLGIRKILVEGGGEVRWSFFKEKLVDELFVWIIPYVWGGRVAPTLVDGDGFLKAEDAIPLRLENTRVVDDVLTLWFSVRR